MQLSGVINVKCMSWLVYRIILQPSDVLSDEKDEVPC